MQRSTILILVMLVGMAASVALFVFGGFVSGGVGQRPPAGTTPGGTVDGASPDEGDETTGSSQQPVPVPPDAPHVELTVTALERFVPPPTAERVLATTPDGRPLSLSLLAGIGAGFDADRSARGVVLVEVDFATSRLLRQLPIGPEQLAPNVIGARIVLRGQIVDEAQKPVRDAAVWFGEWLADGERHGAVTDEEGRFELDAPAGEGVPFVVEATGLAAVAQWLRVTGQAGELRQVLRPACQLQLQLAARAEGMAAARAFVVPADALSTDLLRWPFFLQACSDGHAIDERGRATIDGLPQDCEIGVVVRHPLTALTAPVKVRLEGEHGNVVVPLRFADGRLVGSVVDDDGQPLRDVRVWARDSSRSLGSGGSMRLLPPHLDALGTCAGSTDEAGRFVVGAVGERDAILSLRAQQRAGRDLPQRELAEQPIVLPTWRGGDASLIVIAPVADRAWTVQADLGGGVRASCAANASWPVALPYAGRFDVVIKVTLAGGEPSERRIADLMVTGPVTLETSK